MSGYHWTDPNKNVTSISTGALPLIVTTHINPPIPMRAWDWCATFDGYEPGDLIGYGPSEENAKLDLMRQSSDEIDPDEAIGIAAEILRQDAMDWFNSFTCGGEWRPEDHEERATYEYNMGIARKLFRMIGIDTNERGEVI